MKRKFGMLVILCLLSLTGCNQNSGETSPDVWQTQSEEEKFSYSPILRLEEMEIQDADDPAGILQRQSDSAMVKIIAGNLAGSGVLYDADDEYLWIVTAQHVLEQAGENVQVTFADGFQTNTDLIIRSKTYDLAYLKVRREALMEELIADSGKTQRLDHGENYRLASVSKEAYDKVGRGDMVIAMGSKSGIGEDAYAGMLLQDYAYVKDFDAYLMVADVLVTPGMSGGGLFDARGNLLGIICGVAEDGEVAVAPLLGIMTMER